MERELYRRLYEITYHLGKTRRTKHVVFPDHKIAMVYFWAVLHDRPTGWACQRTHWPDHARQLRLPTASTMSRRLRRNSVRQLIDCVEHNLKDRFPINHVLLIDAKPLPIGHGSKDRQAKVGYATGRLAKGYKLHAVCSQEQVAISWTLRPMNERESLVAPRLIDQLPGQGILVGDNAYDTNPLYEYAGERGWQLLAPRRKNTSLGKIKHSRWRVNAHVHMSQSKRHRLYRARIAIEQFFGQLGNISFGLSPLPNWVRSVRRVRQWVQAKLVLYLLRLAIKRKLA